MQMTLKKVRKVEKLLRAALAKVELNGSVRLSAYGEYDERKVSQSLDEKVAEYDRNLAVYVDGTRTVARLRKLVSDANATSGIDDAMAEHALLKSVVARLAEIPAPGKVVAAEVARKLQASLTQETSPFRDLSESVALSGTRVADELSKARKRVLALEDVLARENQVRSVEVLDEDVLVLEAHDLV